MGRDSLDRDGTLNSLSRTLSDPAFLAAVCHDLRGPLGAIGTWIHVLSSGRADAATQQQALAAMQRDVVAQGRVIEGLGVLSSILAGTLSPVLEELDLVSLLRGLGLPAQVSAGTVLADVRLLRQLLAVLAPSARDSPQEARDPGVLAERGEADTILIRGTCRKGAPGLVDTTVARALAEVQGGHLTLVSGADGTIFVIQLPTPPLAPADRAP